MTVTTKPAKPTKPARAAKPSTTRARSRKPKTSTPRRGPDHAQIAERAYFIHLQDDGSDELGNWLRAERELAAA